VLLGSFTYKIVGGDPKSSFSDTKKMKASSVIQNRVPTKSLLIYDSLNLDWLFTSPNGVRVKDCDIRAINFPIR
jgi:hypothetical protein